MLRRTAVEVSAKEAVVCGESRISFAELDAATTAVAAFLASRGVGRGDRVGIFAAKSVDEVIAIYGILRAGATFVHINPQFREPYLRHTILDCGIETLFVDGARRRIVDGAFADASPLDSIVSFADTGRPAASGDASVDSFSDVLEAMRAAPDPKADVRADDLAAVIYTSGSTGMPKGIMVTQRIFHDATVASAEVLGNDRSDRLISVTPFSFDGALSQLFTAVLVGGTLVQQRSTFPKDIVKTLLDERITGFHAMPALWAMLLQERSPFSRHRYDDLRYVSIIGEVLPDKHLTRLRGLLPSARFYLMYGTTEAFRSTYLPPEDLDSKLGSAGIPFPGVSISIIDDEGRACPAGRQGTIVHDGAFVSPGYWNDPTRTAKTFVDGAVRTGDIGWVDEDGYLYFAGRGDGLIKVQGFRVSPEEVETCIHALDTVAEVAVIGVPLAEIGTVVTAYVVLHEGASTSTQDVTRHCRRRLPAYMVPGVVEFRTVLPKTSGGKIDRAALTRTP